MGRRTDARLKRVNWGHYHSSIFGSTEMIDPAVVLQAALPPERLRYNIQEEMALAPGLWPAWPSCWWDSSITRTLSGAKASVMAEKHSKSGKLKYAIDPHGPSIGRAAQWHWYVYEPGRPGVLATGVAKGARRNAELEGQAAIHRLERERERKKSKRKVQRRGSKAS
jgi:hypothetical protein